MEEISADKRKFPVPLWHEIPNGLQVGTMVEVRGTVPFGADVFQINFVDSQDSGRHEGKRIFHMSVRFTTQTVVRNSKLNGIWGDEEKSGPFRFSSGKSFIILILVQHQGFKVAVDGQHCFEYAHRCDLFSARYLYIDGSIRIDEVQYYMSPEGPGTCFPTPGTCVPTPGTCIPTPGTCVPPPERCVFPPIAMPQTIYNPTIPFIHQFCGGLVPGMNIFIQGRPSASVHRFSINLQCGKGPYPAPDIAFHFDVRHFNYTVVRNTRTDNQWGPEEVLTPEFPFQPAVNFDLIVRVEPDRYSVTVNGMHYVDFRHRILPLSRVNTLVIEDDVVVSSVRFQ